MYHIGPSECAVLGLHTQAQYLWGNQSVYIGIYKKILQTLEIVENFEIIISNFWETADKGEILEKT